MVPYKRYGKYVKKNKYNINTSTWDKINVWHQVGTSKLWYANQVIVDPSTVGGTRKVKRFVLNMAVPTTYDSLFWYALVYVPEGTQPSQPSLSGEGYSPSQYVIAQGMLTNQMPVRLNTPMSRNLNQSDRIMLIIWIKDENMAADTEAKVAGFIQYAICYN